MKIVSVAFLCVKATTCQYMMLQPCSVRKERGNYVSIRDIYRLRGKISMAQGIQRQKIPCNTQMAPCIGENAARDQ